jgi:hypothetical protein
MVLVERCGCKAISRSDTWILAKELFRIKVPVADDIPSGTSYLIMSVASKVKRSSRSSVVDGGFL